MDVAEISVLRSLNAADWPSAEPLYHSLTRSGAVAGRAQFDALLAHSGTAVLGHFLVERLTAMATLHVLPNVTYGGRPYGLVENVVTDPDYRMQGHGRAVLEHIRDLARDAGCYKLMLLTGRGRNARGFYEAAGFSADEKWGMMIRF